MVFAVVTGGGTSGHVIPAQAILEALEEAGHPVNTLRYVGSRRGIESSLMTESEIECVYLPISGLQRSLSFTHFAQNLALPFRLLRSRIAARSLIKQWKPRVVVSVGGYASEPMSRAAIAHKVPLVCVSYDRTPGLATRRQARHATACAVAFSDSVLPHAVHTGAPVRAEIRHINVAQRRESALRLFGLPADASVVTIVGGSLGSGVLNSIAQDLIDALGKTNTASLVLFHVAGPKDSDGAINVPSNMVYRRVGYETQMADLYSVTDVLVARAGASTVAEIATIGIASVIVPWAGAASDHQSHNAAWLGENNAAIVCSEVQCSAGGVTEAVVQLMSHPEQRIALVAHSRALGDVHRSGLLVEEIENAAL